MLKIRLQRVGRKNDPSFRVIVGEDSNAAKSGKFLEILGNYNARGNHLDLKVDRIKHWLAQGVKTSDTVHNLLITGGVIEGKKRDVAPKAPAKKEPESVAELTPVTKAPETAPEVAPVEEAPAEETKEEVQAEPTPAEEAPVAEEAKTG